MPVRRRQCGIASAFEAALEARNLNGRSWKAVHRASLNARKGDARLPASVPRLNHPFGAVRANLTVS